MSLAITGVANAYVLNAVFGRFDLLLVTILLALECAGVAVVLMCKPAWRPVVRWSSLEVVGGLAVGVVFLLHVFSLAPVGMMPVSHSVDCAHQHLLVDFIYRHSSFPEDAGYLYIYDDYPVGPSALAAFLAHLGGIFPVQTMYPIAGLLVAAQVVLVHGVISELLPQSVLSSLVAVLAALGVFLPYSYSVRAFTEHFYSNMLMGNLIVLLALWAVVVFNRIPGVWRVALTLGLTVGCLQSYPAWLPFVVTPLIASLLWDQRTTRSRRFALVGGIIVLVGVFTAVAVLDQWEFITWFAPSRDRRLIPGWSSLGGILLIPALVGMVVLCRFQRQYRGLFWFVLIDASIVIALYGLAWVDWLTLYIPDKTFYFNAFLLLTLAGLGIGRLLDGRRVKRWISQVAIFIVSLSTIVAVNHRHSPPDRYPITLDEYRVAYQAARETPEEEFAYLVRESMTFYWIYGCILNHTHDLAERRDEWIAAKPTVEQWMNDSAGPRRAIVSEISALPADGRWRALATSGDAGIVERTP
ncbi:MAG: hypothetical protein GX620_02755 [Chloroflexi bacterium]|nr:hypothetical protein [Chloroflexota bacterium]